MKKGFVYLIISILLIAIGFIVIQDGLIAWILEIGGIYFLFDGIGIIYKSIKMKS
jgi:hypothetical protein